MWHTYFQYITSDSYKFEPHIKAYLSISLDRMIVLTPSIPRFKCLGMSNLQYWIRICQKSHCTVTNHNHILCVVRILMKQTLRMFTIFHFEATGNQAKTIFVWQNQDPMLQVVLVHLRVIFSFKMRFEIWKIKWCLPPLFRCLPL